LRRGEPTRKFQLTAFIIAGFVAGLIIHIGGIVLSRLLLGEGALASVEALDNAAIVGSRIPSVVLAFASGVVALGLYIFLRPRVNPPLQASILAGLVIWAAGQLYWRISQMATMQCPPPRLVLELGVGQLIAMVVATVTGAVVYDRLNERIRRRATADSDIRSA